MRIKRSVLCFALIFAVLVGVTWFVLRPREPVYDGKPLSYWLGRYRSSDLTIQPEPKADDAIRHIGTSAIPFLLPMLRAKDPDWQKRLLMKVHFKFHLPKDYPVLDVERNARAGYAFWALGPVASNAVPALVQILDDNISESSQMFAVSSLRAIGPAASNAVPSLIKLTTNAGFKHADLAISSLGKIHAQPDIVVPLLMQFLTNSNPRTRYCAAEALSDFGINAPRSVPTTQFLLADPDPFIQSIALPVRRQIEPTNNNEIK